MLCLPPERVTAPAVTPVTLAEAKLHLRVDDDDTALDDEITRAIEAATGHLDGRTGILGRALVTQKWRQFSSFWPASRVFDLALAPVASIEQVALRLADGTEIVLDPSGYRLLSGNTAQPKLLLPVATALPALAQDPDAIAIDYVAGYGDAAAVPSELKSAILLMVGDLYRYRGTATLGQAMAIPMTPTVDRLITPFRRFLV
jgi:uncharacterized phiE125 gp8 family phage protein